MYQYKSIKEIAEYFGDIVSSEDFPLEDPVSKEGFVIVRSGDKTEKEKKSKSKITEKEYLLWTLKKEENGSYSSLFQLKVPGSTSNILELRDYKKSLSSEKEGVCEAFIRDAIKAVLAKAFQSSISLKSQKAFKFIYLQYNNDIVDISEAVRVVSDKYKIKLGVFGHSFKPPVTGGDLLRNMFALRVADIAKKKQQYIKDEADNVSLEKEGWFQVGPKFK